MLGIYGAFAAGKGGFQRTTPAKFYTDIPPERIIGVETEYDIQNGSSRYSALGEASRYITKHALRNAGIQSLSGFTDLGSRIYSDVGYAEHCTPECLGPYQAAAADIASIAVMSSIIESSNIAYKGLYRISGTWRTDEEIANGTVSNVTNGVHENFMAPAEIAEHELFPKLLPTYYATRVAAMAGTVSQNQYVFSQKHIGIGGEPIAWAIERRTSPAAKPMALALARDAETISDGWMRLETRYADAPLSLAARRHALATTSLMLRICEHSGKFDADEFDDIILKDPVAATHRFMTDLTLKSTAEVASGKQMSMMDINEKLAEKVLFLCERTHLPRDEVDAAHRWVDINDAFRRSKPHKAEYDRLLVRDFPVATKHLWLHRSGAFEKGDTEAKTRSLQWDRISPVGNGMKMMEKSSIVDPRVEELKSAPPDTRAKIRANFVKDHHADPRASVRSWRRGRFTYGAAVDFGDPYGVVD